VKPREFTYSSEDVSTDNSGTAFTAGFAEGVSASSFGTVVSVANDTVVSTSEITVCSVVDMVVSDDVSTASCKEHPVRSIAQESSIASAFFIAFLLSFLIFSFY